MSAEQNPKLVASAQAMLDKAWTVYWLQGVRTLEPVAVMAAIQEVCTGADCREDELPACLTELLDKAKKAMKVSDESLLKLVHLIEPLKTIVLPARQQAT